MSEPQHPSSIPPRRARHAAVTAFIGASATLLIAVATRITLAPPEPAEPPVVETRGDKPLPEPVKEEPTTDDGVVAARLVRKQANDVLIEHQDRLHVLELRACILERTARELQITVAGLEAGKRASEVRAEVRRVSSAWADCGTTLDAMQKRTSLRDAADSALRR